MRLEITQSYTYSYGFKVESRTIILSSGCKEFHYDDSTKGFELKEWLKAVRFTGDIRRLKREIEGLIKLTA